MHHNRQGIARWPDKVNNHGEGGIAVEVAHGGEPRPRI